MELQHDNGEVCTRRFVRVKSGSLIIHEGVVKNAIFSRFFNFEWILVEVIDGHFLWSNMIEHPFLSILAKTACPGKLRLIFSKISRATRLADFKSSLAPFHHSTIATVSSIMFWCHKGQWHACCPAMLLCVTTSPFHRHSNRSLYILVLQEVTLACMLQYNSKSNVLVSQEACMLPTYVVHTALASKCAAYHYLTSRGGGSPGQFFLLMNN